MLYYLIYSQIEPADTKLQVREAIFESENDIARAKTCSSDFTINSENSMLFFLSPDRIPLFCDVPQ